MRWFRRRRDSQRPPSAAADPALDPDDPFPQRRSQPGPSDRPGQSSREGKGSRQGKGDGPDTETPRLTDRGRGSARAEQRWRPPVRFEDAFAVVHHRVDQIVQETQTGVPAADPDSSATMAEAGALWDAAQPVDPQDPSETEADRLKAARHLLGWLHCVRFYRHRPASDLGELAQSVVLLAPYAESDPETIPDPLEPLIGARSVAQTQTQIAAGFIEVGLSRSDPAVSAAAVELLTRAVAATAAGHPDRPARLGHLAAAHVVRADATADAQHAQLALEHSQAALDAATAAGLADLTEYQRQYEVAQQLCLRVGSAAADAHPAVPRVTHLFTSTEVADPAGLAADLDSAIEQAHRQIGEQPADLVGTLRVRAARHLAAYARDGLMVSLEAALLLLATVLEVAPEEGGADRAALGAAQLTRFRRTGAGPDLELAISCLEQALAADAVTQAERLAALDELVLAYRLRFVEFGEAIAVERLRELVRAAQDAWTVPPAYPVRTLTALGQLAQAIGEHDLAVSVLTDAVRELPAVTRWGLTWSDKEHDLAGHAGLVQDAISAHLQIGDVDGALVTAELGRGVLLSAQLELRTDLSGLRRVRPDLADRFERVGPQIDAGIPVADRERTSTEARGWLRQKEWTRLLQEIRQVEGYTDFLAPPTVAELLPADPQLAVVLVTAGPHRADAIVLPAGAGEAVAVPLPGLMLADVHAYAAVLAQTEVENWAHAAEWTLPDLLEWLWTAAVQPVLAALDLLEPHQEGQPWARVCWIPTGLLGLMPFHAAGAPDGPNTLDRVISSYSPTVRALQQARGRAGMPRRQLSVAMEHTPGYPDLPQTVAEAWSVQPQDPDSVPLTNQNATTARVLEGLRTATWVHFSCHAESDVIVPSRSGLLLHDGLLPLLQIARLPLPQAELAYLSACSTARTGWRNADEVLNLASAFQAAGFRHVIASLWPLDDAVAARAAHRFYQLISADPETPTDADGSDSTAADARPGAQPGPGPGVAADRAAVVLHQVTQELRRQYPEYPEAWAPLIHSGP